MDNSGILGTDSQVEKRNIDTSKYGAEFYPVVSESQQFSLPARGKARTYLHLCIFAQA